MAVRSRKFKREEKCLLIGFAASSLSQSPSHHVLDFMKSELTAPLGNAFTVPLINMTLPRSEDPSDSDCEIVEEDTSADETVSFEQSLLFCSDKEFYHLFKMKRSSMQVLLEMITSYITENRVLQGICPNVALSRKILVTVWLLGNCQSFKRAGRLFGLTRIDTEACFLHICSILVNLLPKYIVWPNPGEEERLIECVEGVYGFPGVVGMLGNKIIQLPRSYGTLRKNMALIQAVVDHDQFFRDVYVGPPGVDSVQTVFHTSGLYNKLVNKKKPLIGPHKHIIGNKDYPQLATLLTPYKDVQCSEEEVEFNKSLETAHGLVDKVFHTLFGRFRRLKLLDVREAEHISIVVKASCVLHNFLLKIKDIFEAELPSKDV